LRRRQHFFINETPDDLAMLENEGHFARTHLQYRARPLPARAGMTEARIEEACVVNTEFADQRVDRHHFGGVIRRHLHRFLCREDGELAGIENEAAVWPGADRL